MKEDLVTYQTHDTIVSLFVSLESSDYLAPGEQSVRQVIYLYTVLFVDKFGSNWEVKNKNMADHNNNLVLDNISRLNIRNLPPVPQAPKKTKPARTEEVKQPAVFNGRPVPTIYKVAARRRLCEDKEEFNLSPYPFITQSNVSPYPITSQPNAPQKNKKYISLHSLLYKSPLLGRKPVAKRLFAEDYLIDSQDISLESFTVFATSPKHI
ncbi:hypothetical protein Btru_048386 [Bulinus truncatus]|nr:hypothetical protein Btru_048386 [Bulinus truncatus]